MCPQHRARPPPCPAHSLLKSINLRVLTLAHALAAGSGRSGASRGGAGANGDAGCAARELGESGVLSGSEKHQYVKPLFRPAFSGREAAFQGCPLPEPAVLQAKLGLSRSRCCDRVSGCALLYSLHASALPFTAPAHTARRHHCRNTPGCAVCEGSSACTRSVLRDLVQQ